MQPETVSRFLRREAVGKDAREVLCGDADSVIFDLNLQHSFGGNRCAEDDAPIELRRPLAEGFTRVLEQINQNLQDLLLVDPHLGYLLTLLVDDDFMTLER